MLSKSALCGPYHPDLWKCFKGPSLAPDPTLQIHHTFCSASKILKHKVITGDVVMVKQTLTKDFLYDVKGQYAITRM